MIVVMLGPAERADGRTWRVTANGLGDAPHLDAAMDSASAGDTVLVAAGEYQIESILVTNGINLIGEEGPRRTKLFPFPGQLGGLSCTNLSLPTLISGIWFDRFDSGGDEELGAINILDCLSIVVRNCVFSNNDFAGISINTQQEVTIESCTFADNAFALNNVSGGGWLSHNIFWDSIVGLELSFVVVCNDVLNIQDIPGPFQSANFSVDPLFCAGGDYRIKSTSPCVAGASPLGGSCQLIGALEADCSTTPVQTRTWGSIKALYRKR